VNGLADAGENLIIIQVMTVFGSVLSLISIAWFRIYIVIIALRCKPWGFDLEGKSF
jgi:hypothetical protein